MIRVDAKNLVRSFIVCAVVAPWLGCGAKSETDQNATSRPQANPAQSASSQPAAAPPSSEQFPDGPPVTRESGTATPGAAELAGHDTDPDEAAPGTAAPGTVAPGESAPDGAGADEADRPRSLFRSIGRALGKGMTDAAVRPADTPASP